MARPHGSASTDRIEFFKKFDKLAKDHIDPLMFMFEVCKGESKSTEPVTGKVTRTDWEKQFRLQAGRELIGYRYPKLKAIEQAIDVGDGQLSITWLDEIEEAIDAGTDNHSVPSAQISVIPASK
jgi:hypothetical protein